MITGEHELAAGSVGVMFTTDSVAAIGAKIKTQTRRLFTRGPNYVDGSRWSEQTWAQLEFDKAWVDPGPSPAGNRGPYLKVPRYDPSGGGRFPEGGTVHRVYPAFTIGSRWYVKESVGVAGAWAIDPCLNYRDGTQNPIDRKFMTAVMQQGKFRWHEKWRSPLLMPRWAARHFLEVTAVKIERLQDMHWRDALAEGIEPVICKHEGAGPHGCTDCMGTGILENPVDDYQVGWDKMHPGDTVNWAANPWVIAYTFQQLTSHGK